MTKSLLIFVVATLLVEARAQRVGDFTRAQIEHEITLLEHPIVVNALRGRVCAIHNREAALMNVLVEIQGPGKSRRIRRTTADTEGRFKLNRVPFGTYRFKATLNGWRSVMGEIVLTKVAPLNEILIEMHPGT